MSELESGVVDLEDDCREGISEGSLGEAAGRRASGCRWMVEARYLFGVAAMGSIRGSGRTSVRTGSVVAKEKRVIAIGAMETSGAAGAWRVRHRWR